VKAARRILRNRSLVIGGVIVAGMFLIAAFAPWIAGYNPNAMDMGHRLEGPTGIHWLGTDNFGRDLWARMAYGSRISVLIALVSVAVSAALGTAVGLCAGYFGGTLDLLVMRVVDLVLGFPIIILSLGLVAALGPGPINVAIALIFVFWGQYARVVRAVVLAEKQVSYVEAARAIGASTPRILFHHVFRNSWAPVLVLATLGMGTAILSESALSFLGFGVQPPAPTWGWTLSYGIRFLRDDPWLSTVPGLAIMITVLGYNLFGDGLRNILDPRGVSR